MRYPLYVQFLPNPVRHAEIPVTDRTRRIGTLNCENWLRRS